MDRSRLQRRLTSILMHGIKAEAKRRVSFTKFCLSDRHRLCHGHIEARCQSGGEGKRACLRTKHQRFGCKSGQFERLTLEMGTKLPFNLLSLGPKRRLEVSFPDVYPYARPHQNAVFAIDEETSRLILRRKVHCAVGLTR